MQAYTYILSFFEENNISIMEIIRLPLFEKIQTYALLQSVQY